MARIVFIKNPFDPIDSREITDIEKNITLKEAIQQIVGVVPEEYELSCFRNSQEETNFDITLSLFDNVIFCLTPKGGGDSKNIARMVAMLAVVLSAPYLASMWGGGWAASTAGVLTAKGVAFQAGITVAGSLIVNALLPVNVAPMDLNWGGLKSSSTYAWDSKGNKNQEGIALPVIYGRHRVVPPVISRYVSQSGDNQYLNILYAVAGHEVQAIEDIRINEQSITAYSDITTEIKLGTNDQTAIVGFDDVRTTTRVYALIEYGSPISRETTSNVINGLAVGVHFPRGLFLARPTFYGENTVEIRVRYRLVGGAWSTKDFTISDNTNHIKSTYLEISEDLEVGQYEVEVSLLEEPLSGVDSICDVYFDYVREIVSGDRFTYPNTALLAVKALATNQLSGQDPLVDVIIERSELPNTKNASNPAWICEDILRDTEYGGSALESQIIASSFTEWGDYCDTNSLYCNIYYDVITTIRQALNMVSLIGWGSVLQIGSKYMPIVEKEEETPVQRFLFTVGNILYDSYQEEYLSQEERANSIEIAYYDEELNNEKQVIEILQHNFDTTETEIKKTELDLIGQTSRDNAIRHGKRMLNFNRYLTLTSSWNASIDSLACRIGDVVDVQHDLPQYGFGGRIEEVISTTQVKIDRDVTFEEGLRYYFTVKDNEDNRQTVEVINSENTTSTLSFLEEITLNIQQYDLYSFGEIDSETKAFRVINITRQSDQLRKITGIEYVPEVYDDEAEIPIYEDSALTYIRDLRALSVWEHTVNGAKLSKISVNWGGESLYWDVYIEKPNQDFTFYERVYKPSIIIQEEFQVYDTVGIRVVVGETQSSTINHVVEYPPKPDDVLTFKLNVVSQNAILTWISNKTLDLDFYRIKFSKNLVGASWENAILLVDVVAGNTITTNAMVGTYLIKAVDVFGQESENALTIVSTLQGIDTLNAVELIEEEPTFGGERTDVAIRNDTYLQLGNNRLDFDGNDYVNAVNPISAYPFTLSGWAKTDTLGESQALLSLCKTGVSDKYWAIGLSDTNVAIITARNTTAYSVLGSSSITTDRVHITGVFNSATDRKLYVNGIYEDVGVDSVAFDATVDLAVTGVGTTTVPISYFKGKIDDARIYDKALSADEVLALYNGEDVPNNLINRWKMNEGSGATVSDSWGSNDGTINGATWCVEIAELGTVGYYYFDNNVDLIDVFSSRVSGEITATGENVYDKFFDYEKFFDKELWFGTPPKNWNVSLEIATSTTYGEVAGASAIYHFDGDATDSSGNGNDGVLSGTPPTLATGMYDQCYSFNGSSNFITVSDDNTLDLTTAFTICCWIKPDSLTETNDYILSKLNEAETDSCYSIVWEYVNNTIEFYGDCAGSPRTGSQMVLPDAGWHFISYSYDGTNLVGILDDKVVFKIEKSFTLNTSTKDLLIGTFKVAGTKCFKGLIDELMIYPTALTTAQVSTLMRDYGDYQSVVIGDYLARTYKARLKFDSTEVGITPVVSYASLEVDMPDRIQKGLDVVCTAGGISVDWAEPFKVLQSVTYGFESMASGDYYTVTNKDETGFDIEAFDSGDVSVEKTFDYTAIGYGRKTT